MPEVKVERVTVGAFAENCYIVRNGKTDACVIVDPGAEAQRIIGAVGAGRPEAVLLTHAHCDHIGAVDEVCAHYGIPLYVHEADAPKLADSAANVARYFGFEMTVQTPPTLLNGGETVTLAEIPFQVLHTPGHSAGSVCYLLPENQGVLTGDTLFAHGYGRTDFPDGSFSQIRESLKMLYHLTPKRRAYPGHDELGWAGRDRTEDA